MRRSSRPGVPSEAGVAEVAAEVAAPDATADEAVAAGFLPCGAAGVGGSYPALAHAGVAVLMGKVVMLPPTSKLLSSTSP